MESYWPDWAKTFAPAGWSAGANSFPGTAFRLPLRSVKDAEQSEIIQEPFTEEDFEAILHELKQVGAALLVFLRSVRSIEVREINPDGTDKLRFSISTINESEVDQHRAILREAVEGNPKELLESWLNSTDALPIVHFNHSFLIYDIDKMEREETWAVTSGLFRGPENALLHAALDVWKHQEKAIPWAGAAVCRSVPEQVVRSGGLACFLPLPEPTSWPVWLNGWFDLSSNRRGITRSADVGETTHARYRWNQSLMEYAVGKAWALLIQNLAEQADKNLSPYTLWPRSPDKIDEVDECLQVGFYQAAAKLLIVRGLNAKGHQWYRLGEGVRDLPAKWHSRLTAPFLVEGWTIFDPPLPRFVRQGFQKADQEILSITPQSLREELHTGDEIQDIACALEDAPRPMLTKRDWICSLAEFCADGDWNNLRQLPLALLADNLLHTFTECGTLYLVGKEEEALLAPLPDRLLETEYQKTIRLDKPSEDINVVELDLEGLIDCIPHVLEKDQANTEWLREVFDYLTARSTKEVERHKKNLNCLALIPDQHGRWCKMTYINTPLIPGEVSKTIQHALSRLGIPLLHGPEDFILAISRFSSKHTGFIWHLTPNDIADNLKDHAKNQKLDEAALDDPTILHPLLDFLASTNWLKADDERLPLLRKVRMLPTTCGKRVAAETENVYVPGGFSPPKGMGGQYQLLGTGKQNQWLDLFKTLGVPTLNGSTFVEKVLLPAFSDTTREQHYQFLVWLRDEFRLVERELDEEERKRLRQKIRFAPILPIEGGGLAAPREVYRPDAEAPPNLLGRRAKIPDKEFFTPQKDLWNEFFEEFRLPRQPLAHDLLNAIRDLIDQSNTSGTISIRDPLRKLMDHLRDRWSKLSERKFDGGATFAEELSQLAWLPAVDGENSNYPACAKWPDRLWRADKLVSRRIANLVASKRPVLDGVELPDQMMKDLGLITQVKPSEVLEHFSSIRALPLADGPTTGIRRAVTEIYRFIGQLDQPLIQVLTGFESLKTESCILVGNQWMPPNRCFLEPLPFATSWAFSLTKTEIDIDQPIVHKGLERLGVRTRPDNDDWLQMLWDLAEEFDKRALSPNALNQARHALRCLRGAPSDWLSERKVLVPLFDGRLEEAQHSLVPDDPRLNRMACLTPLPLIEDNEDAIDIGSRSGAKSLRRELIDRLKESPKPTQKTKLQDFSLLIEQRVRSNHFYQSLRRIAYEEALGRNDADPRAAASISVLERPKSLQIRIAPEIPVESVVKIQSEEVIAFELNAASFLEDAIPRLWLKEGSRRKMGDELVRALCKLCDLTDQLRLSRVLEVEPNQMAKLLDEEEVANLPEGQTLELDYGSEELVLETEEGNFAPESPDLSPQDEPPDLYPDEEWDLEGDETIKTEEDVPQSSAFSESMAQRTTGGPPSVSSGSQSAEAGGPTDNDNKPPPKERGIGARRTSSEVSAGTPRGNGTQGASGNRNAKANTGKPSTPTGPPTRPGQGSSTAWSDGPPGDSCQTKQVRLRSYVHEREQTDYDMGDAEPRAKEIGDFGESIVILWEKKQGRSARLMPPNHEGYDIESNGPEGTRYIEVKSIEGSWGIRGVGVTRAQYNAALRHGHTWWLYVVEHATEAEGAVVHTIQNPFYQITEYRFDAGWQEARPSAAEPQAEPAGPKIGAQYEKPDGNLVRIIQTSQRGSLWRVTVEMQDGSTQLVPWNPSWRRI